MKCNANKDITGTGSAQSLEALIKTIDLQVAKVPALSTAESFAAFLGGRAEDYRQQGEQYIRFSINGIIFALPLQNTLEIGYIPQIIPLPNIPQWVLGICNIRGDIVSVIDLKQIFQLEQDSIDTVGKFIMIRNQGVSTAIVVDNIAGMLIAKDREHQQDLTSIADKPFSKFIKNVIISGHKSVYRLDLDALIRAIKI